MTKYVYDFHEGSKDQKDLLGGKGAGLAEMTNLGLPVPPGFTISTDACRAYLELGHEPPGLADEVSEHLEALERATGRTLGQADGPLLVSVRSGAKFSMPGMMETVLDVGLNDQSVHGLGAFAGEDERFAYDSRTILRRPDGSFLITVAPRAQPGNWLPVASGKRFSLVLRLYDTPLTSAARPAAISMPTIRKSACP